MRVARSCKVGKVHVGKVGGQVGMGRFSMGAVGQDTLQEDAHAQWKATGCHSLTRESGDRERERVRETERERGEEHGEVAKRKARAPHDRERQTRELVPTAQVDLQARAFKLSELIQESVCSVSRGEIHASGTS